MNGIDFILLAVMITCAAFVGAINSRGITRMILSYVLATACLGISGFKIAQHAMASSKQRNMELAEAVSQDVKDELIEDVKEELIETIERTV